MLDAYIRPVPCDPRTKGPYLYELIEGDNASCPTKGYRILTDLERDGSEASNAIYCGGVNGCGVVVGEVVYDYGVAQGGPVSLADPAEILTEEPTEEPAGEPTPTPKGGGKKGGGKGGGGGGEPPAQDWCCQLSGPVCLPIVNGLPDTCNRDYHGVNSQQACITNCRN
ncbi:MAG: hypothetical protein A2632_00065 [Candidatus Pacebacteria bacterium RIFCSPHIGHO2_01_FULL_46_16]|nr:MAG: hypothetical protein A2632_00065 [Candidatus Pacebacteria bacterium RIFCSPHIGHO2_01_FULL_46_16]